MYARSILESKHRSFNRDVKWGRFDKQYQPSFKKMDPYQILQVLLWLAKIKLVGLNFLNVLAPLVARDTMGSA